MKFLVRILIVLVVIALLGAFGLITYSGSLVKKAVEKGGTSALGVETRLEEARLDLFGGTLALDGLSVANPQEFDREHFLSLGHAELEVSLKTLRSDTIEAPLLLFDGVEIDLEKRGKASNYQTILDHLDTGSGGGGEAEPSASEGGKRFVLREVVLRNVKAHVDFQAAGTTLAKTTVEVPEIRLEGVGERSMTELASEIVTAVLKASVSSLDGVVPAEILGDLKGQVAGLQGRAQELAGQVQGKLDQGAKDATKKVQEGVQKGLGEAEKKLGKGLGGLLGGKKDG